MPAPLFGAAHLALMRALFERLALVGLFLCAAEPKLQFYESVFQECAKGDEHLSFFLKRAGQRFYFIFREQKLSRAVFFVSRWGVLRLVGRDVGVHEPRLAIADQNPRARYLKAAAFCAFHLVAEKFYAGIVGVRNLIIKPRSAVFRNGFHTSIIAVK